MEITLSDESTVGEDAEIETETPEAEIAEGEVVLEAEEVDAEPEGDGPEVIEFDFAGTKYQVPTGSSVDEVAERIQELATNLQGDYTRKTQSVAEERKQVEEAAAKMQAQQESLDKLEGLSNERLATVSQGLLLQREIEQLRAMDPNGTLWQSNPDQARQVSDAIAQKQAQLNAVTQQAAQQEADLAQARSADIERRMQEGREFVTSRVSDFDETALVDYAANNGIPREDAEKWSLSPAVAIIVDKARRFDALQAKATRVVPKSVKPAKPARGGSSRRVVNLNDGKTSSKDWFKAREKQLKESRASR